MTRLFYVLGLLFSIFLSVLASAQNDHQKLDSIYASFGDHVGDPCLKDSIDLLICNYYISKEDYDSIYYVAKLVEESADKAGCLEVKGTALSWQAWYYGIKNDHQKSLELNLRVRDVLGSVGDTIGMTVAILNAGYNADRLGFPDEALKNYLEVLELYHRVQYDNQTRLASLNFNIASNYSGSQQFDLAIQHGITAIAHYKNDKNDEGVALVEGLLASVYLELESFEKSLYYARKSLAWYDKYGKKVDLHQALLVVVDVFEATGNLDSADYFASRCLTSALKEADQTSIGNAYLNVAEIALRKGNVRSAIENGEKALTHLREHSNYGDVISAYHLMSGAQLQQKKPLLALDYASKGFRLADSLNQSALKLDLAVSLTNIHLELGNTEESGRYLALERHLRDSLSKLTNREVFSRLQIDYETEQTENENLRLRISNDSLANAKQISEAREKQISAEARETKAFLIGSVMVALLLLVLGLIVYRAYRRKKSTAVLLAKQDAEKAILLKEIHHRVKNNLQIIASILNLQLRSISDPDALSAVKQGQNRVQSISIIHQNLYQTENLGEVNFANYINQLSSNLLQVFGKQNIDVNTEITPPDLGLDIDTAVPTGLIINELMTNALKHAFGHEAKGKIDIRIQALPEEGKLKLEVTDNGVGMPENHDPGKAKSLGLLLIRELSRQLNGKISWKRDQGTTFTMYFEPTSVRESKN